MLHKAKPTPIILPVA